MKKSSGTLLKTSLIVGDVLIIVLSFTAAYFFRTRLSSQLYFFQPQKISDFALSILLFIPIWLVILFALGLYKRSVFLGKSHFDELWRVFLAAVLGAMGLITMDFFFALDLFPVRTIVFLAAVLCFVLMILLRVILRFCRKKVLQKSHHATLGAIIIGNNRNTSRLASYLYGAPESGYHLAGVVAGEKYVEDLPKRIKIFESVDDALKKTDPDVIFQTDKHLTEEVYRKSLDYHIPYYFVPNETTLSSQLGELELVGNIPVILAKTTPLTGGAKVVKRVFDILLGVILFVLALIPMAVIWVILKITEPKANPLFSDIRLTQYDREFRLYKFRSMKAEYSGMTPEEAFKKMGKEELIEKYRKNGDFLENDPRVTKVGKFLRKTSLDELPQLWNVIVGDISLIGPRALIPGELKDYGDRSLLLSIKSGLTGLAQVSGRRDISFEERRAIDIYYINNWSLGLDFQILLKTVAAVFKHEGAK